MITSSFLTFQTKFVKVLGQVIFLTQLWFERSFIDREYREANTPESPKQWILNSRQHVNARRNDDQSFRLTVNTHKSKSAF